MDIIDRKTTISVVGLISLLFAVEASAALQWTFSGGGQLVFDDTNPSVEQTFSAGSGTPTVNVSGWSDDGSTGDTGTKRLVSEDVRMWNGLGVVRFGETTPNHGLDNSGPDEMILFDFSADVTLTQIQAGWVSGDSDIVLLAYTGGGTPGLAGFEYAPQSDNTYDPNDGPGGSTVGLTQDGWDLVGTYANIGTAATNVNDFNGTVSGANAVSSSYWLVGAFNATVDPANSGLAGTSDYLKIAMLAGDVYTPPNGSAPAPGVLFLFAAGLTLLSRVRREAFTTA